jgi:hypothetical protein
VPSMKNIILNILKIRRQKFVKFGSMMSIYIFFTVTFFGGNSLTGFFSIIVLIPGWYLRASPLFPQFSLFERDYLQTGYSYMLDISYLLYNNTVKCIKVKIFPFNQN